MEAAGHDLLVVSPEFPVRESQPTGISFWIDESGASHTWLEGPTKKCLAYKTRLDIVARISLIWTCATVGIIRWDVYSHGVKSIAGNIEGFANLNDYNN